YSLSCPGSHPDLHSFPTRRSSDLLVRERGPEVRIEEVVAGPTDVRSFDPVTERPELGGRVRRRAVAVVQVPVGQRGQTADSHARDRKSTRLNSSHVKISYAVFCLK